MHGSPFSCCLDWVASLLAGDQCATLSGPSLGTTCHFPWVQRFAKGSGVHWGRLAGRVLHTPYYGLASSGQRASAATQLGHPSPKLLRTSYFFGIEIDQLIKRNTPRQIV